MLVQEPMLLAVTLYMSFVYGLVYLLFEAFPFVFVMVSRLSGPSKRVRGCTNAGTRRLL